jgi:hypothetical protein
LLLRGELEVGLLLVLRGHTGELLVLHGVEIRLKMALVGRKDAHVGVLLLRVEHLLLLGLKQLDLLLES